MKSSDAEPRPWLGLLGLAFFAWLGWQAGRSDLDARQLAGIYQAGFARVAVKLIPLAHIAPTQADVLRRSLERADVVCSYDLEHLRAVPPFALADDGRFWTAMSDIHPRATMELRWDGSESGSLTIRPQGLPAWQVPLRSKDLVRPDWSPYSGLVAYYDLGRVWIADVQGKKFQSLVQEPLLDEGGRLRFSADGTSLAFYFHADRNWKGQYLYVLKETQ